MAEPSRKLVLRWGKADRWDTHDWVYDYPDYKWNARLLHSLVQGDITFPTFLAELTKRDYDTKTLRLSVRRKPVATEEEPMPEMTTKAYHVTSDEYGEIVFAETPGRAKRMTDLDEEFIHLRVKRAPQFDQFAGVVGRPNKQDLLEGGWWFECDECYSHVTVDEGKVIGNKVYCEVCMSKQEVPHASDDRG